jgi:hypothetical protein
MSPRSPVLDENPIIPIVPYRERSTRGGTRSFDEEHAAVKTAARRTVRAATRPATMGRGPPEGLREVSTTARRALK